MTPFFNAARLSLVAAIALSLCAVPAARAQTTAPAQADDGPAIDEIAAVVGGDIILRSEVDALVQGLRQRPQAPPPEVLWRNALNELINQEVLIDAAQRDTTIRATDDQVEQALNQRIEQLVQQAGSEERLEELYGQSIMQLKEDFREDFRQQLLAQQLQNAKLQEIDITPSEVRAWFEQLPTDSLPRLPETVRLAHIVRYPEVSEEARQEARQLISAIRDSVAAGVPIEDLARRYSDDAASAASGGRYEGLRLSDLEATFAAVAARTPVGEVSQVFETSRGFHILRVNDRQANTVDFNHVLIRIDAGAIDPSETISYLSAVRDSLLRYDVPFALMARRHSEEASSAENGGRVLAPQTGTRDLVLEALGPSWQRTLDTLEVGEISKPTEVELLDGERAYHIVMLQQHLPAHRVSLETDYERIKQYALQEKRARVMQDWIARLREDTYVDIRVDVSDLTAARD